MEKSIEEIVRFLKGLGLNSEMVNTDKYGFSRRIEFKVYNQVYNIVWFKNSSTLIIGSNDRSPQIPFRHMKLDDTFPLVGGNRAIKFTYNLEEITTFSDGYSYNSFRIPLELESN